MGRWIVVFTLPLAFAIAVEVHPVPQTSGRQNTRISRKVGRRLLSPTTEGGNSPTNTARQDAASATYLNVRPGVAYLGSQACAPCHKDIYDSYMRTSMAQAMSLPMQFVKSGRISLPITVFDKKSNRCYQVLTDGSILYQSIYRFDGHGKTIYRETEKVFYVIGTGRNGMGFLVRRGNYLLQAPLAYFPRDKTWELSPGYESFDFGFTRPVSAECVTCHSGIPQPVAGKVGLYQDPSFRELGIGCEKCHGPGQLHVTERQQGQPLAGIDRTIVNPARLSAYLANDICIFCHEAVTREFSNPAKAFWIFGRELRWITPSPSLNRVWITVRGRPCPSLATIFNCSSPGVFGRAVTGLSV
jgi:hypothetical protein